MAGMEGAMPESFEQRDELLVLLSANAEAKEKGPSRS